MLPAAANGWVKSQVASWGGIKAGNFDFRAPETAAMAFAVLDAFIVFTKRVALDRTKNKSEIHNLEIDASVET
jgi:hypothetical protein